MFVGENPLVMGSIAGRQNFGSGTPINAPGTTRRLAADVVSIVTAYATVSGLAINVPLLGPISFEYFLTYSTTTVTDNIGVQLAFGGAASEVVYNLDGYTGLDTRSNKNAYAFASGAAALATPSPGPNPSFAGLIRILGSCIVTGPGDLNVQIRAATAGAPTSVQLNKGSWGRVVAAPV